MPDYGWCLFYSSCKLFSYFGFLFNSIRKQNLVLIKLNSWDDVAWCSVFPFNSVNIATGSVQCKSDQLSWDLLDLQQSLHGADALK